MCLLPSKYIHKMFQNMYIKNRKGHDVRVKTLSISEPVIFSLQELNSFKAFGLICFWLVCCLFLILQIHCGIIHTWKIIKIRACCKVQVKQFICKKNYLVPKSFSK